MSIRGRFSHNFAVTVSHENFILRHDSYVDPVVFVLENDCVVLMGLSPTHVSKVWFLWHFLPTFGQKQYAHVDPWIICDNSVIVTFFYSQKGSPFGV